MKYLGFLGENLFVCDEKYVASMFETVFPEVLWVIDKKRYISKLIRYFFNVSIKF